ncbi:hypothetical protein AVEN_273334-1 [Araneus ventricosus]|uniref:Uncharacterized protein n=1 Tax=Araneus ventricosus TaxID=182803 RepID=A0A4Y2IKF9_ARAVE|nr:hypothetical protein AVEN_273334-1 [Araneus ventricosus]
MRSEGNDIPLSSPEFDSSFPSIPEVSSTPPPLSDKELPLVFPSPAEDGESTPPTTMTPEHRSEPSTLHRNTPESLPATLSQSFRVRKSPVRLIL